MAAAAPFRLENSYARDLQGFSVPWRPEAAPAPKSLFFNTPLAEELGLDAAALAGEAGAALFAGNTVPEGAEPIAQAYAGHQFGGFSPQLGDGRAVLLGEVIDRAGRRRDIALKGSGRTPFSRGGDGKAAVGPMLREVLIGEAMHAPRHPDHACARGRRHRRAGVSRDGAAGRGAHAGRRQPHPRRHVPVLRRPRRRRARAPARRIHASPATTPTSSARPAASSRCSSAWPRARRR